MVSGFSREPPSPEPHFLAITHYLSTLLEHIRENLRLH